MGGVVSLRRGSVASSCLRQQVFPSDGLVAESPSVGGHVASSDEIGVHALVVLALPMGDPGKPVADSALVENAVILEAGLGGRVD